MMPHNERTMRCSCGACIGPLLVQALDHNSTTRHTCVCLMVCQWIVRQGNQSAVLSAHQLVSFRYHLCNSHALLELLIQLVCGVLWLGSC